MNIADMIVLAQEFNGGTFLKTSESDFTQLTLVRGYTVAVRDGYKTFDSEIDPFDLSEYAATEISVGEKLGLWFAKDVWYIDCVEVFSDKPTAFEKAYDNYQLAIFDNKNQVSIYV